jgi:hypothetical protein
MKKLAALLVSAILTVGLLPAASAAGEPNPWKDSSIHIMEIESFESGYPSGDVNQWPGFWSYNQEIGYAPTSGLIKNGQLVINNGGTESFFFKRASGAISSSLLSQAEGVGFYVKNNTKSPVRLAFYGAGDKDKKDNGEAMFFFQKSAATFIDMQGNASTLSGKDSLVSLDAGKEGYVLFSFSDFVDGWHDNKKLDVSKTSLERIGLRLNDGMVNVRYTLNFDHFFLYGKSIKHAPGTISMSGAATTKPTQTKAPTSPATKAPTKTPAGSGTTAPTAPTQDSVASGEETTLPAEETTLPTGETTLAEETTTTAQPVVGPTAANTEEPGGISPAVPILIIAIILVLAVAAVVIVYVVKKKKADGAPQ